VSTPTPSLAAIQAATCAANLKVIRDLAVTVSGADLTTTRGAVAYVAVRANCSAFDIYAIDVVISDRCTYYTAQTSQSTNTGFAAFMLERQAYWCRNPFG
jgi:hypothetical protein